MIRWNRVLVVCASTLLVAACGDSRSSPVGPELEVRRSGGLIIGGNDVPGDTTYTARSAEGDTATADGTGEGENRGGLIIGGN